MRLNMSDLGNVSVLVVAFNFFPFRNADSTGTLTCNQISQATQAGIRLLVEAGSMFTAVATATYNSITGNALGVDNTTANVMNAEQNWWGCPAGPGNAGCDATLGPVDSALPLSGPPLVCPPPPPTTTTTTTTSSSVPTTTTTPVTTTTVVPSTTTTLPPEICEPLTVTQARFRPRKSTLFIHATFPNGTFAGLDPRQQAVQLQVRGTSGELVSCTIPAAQWQELFQHTFGFFDPSITLCPPIKCMRLALPKKGLPHMTINGGRVQSASPLLSPLEITVSAADQCAAGPLTLQPKATGRVVFP